ncbi:MAG: hypothetical protein K2Y29_00490 [Beijerinckiaceae bacterium]|nr:hypothetical protein [Beijerinckiaceae bacterium]
MSDWLRTAFLYVGIFDVAFVLIFGVFLAFLFVTNRYTEKTMERVRPAAISIFLSTLVAAIMLAGISAILGTN